MKKTGSKYNFQQSMPSFHDFSMQTWIRYINSNVNNNDGGINTNDYIVLKTGKTLADSFNVGLTSSQIQEIGSKARLNSIMPDIVKIQNNIIEQFLLSKINSKVAKELLNNFIKSNKQLPAVKSSNIDNVKNAFISFSKSTTNEDIIGYAKTVDEALSFARDLNAPVKKIRVFDFDDTLAQTKSIVFYTKADGTEGKLTAEEFAEKGADLVSEGAVMDFSDFNIVRDGKRGPLFDVAKKIEKARGTEDVFVLTARAPESQQAIHEFLKSEGLNIPTRKYNWFR